jgi:hypothetical protein
MCTVGVEYKFSRSAVGVQQEHSRKECSRSTKKEERRKKNSRTEEHSRSRMAHAGMCS